MIETTLAHSALFPGNILKGEVALTVTSPTPFTAFRVKVVGRERVTYVKERTVPVATEAGASSSSSSSSGRGSAAPPQATERVREYVTHKTRLLKLLLTLAGSMKTLPDNNNSNNSNGRGSLLIPAGRYVYPFELPLPSHIPPSYERTMSNEQDSIAISYHVKVLLVHGGAGGRTTKRYTPFTVLRPMPLSQHQHVSPVTSPPLTFDVHCCWCFHFGSVNCQFVLERNRAILGDVLTVHCDVTNDMKEKTINALRLSLVEMTSYRTVEAAGGLGGAERKSRSTVLSHKVPRVIPRGTHQRFTESIQLQPLNAFASFATENVRVQYKLWVHLDVPWASEVSHGFDLLLGQQLDDSDRAKEVTDIPPSTRTITTSSSSSGCGRNRGSTSWWSSLFGGASKRTTAGSNDNNISSDTIPVVLTSLSKGQLTMPEWYFSPPPEATRPELAARTRMIVPSSAHDGSMMMMMMIHPPPPRGARMMQFDDEGLDVPLPSDQTAAAQGPPPHTPRQRQVNPFRVDEHEAEARRPVMGIVIGTTLPTAPTGLGYSSAVDSSVGGRTNAANVGADGARAAAATRRANNNAGNRTKTD